VDTTPVVNFHMCQPIDRRWCQQRRQPVQCTENNGGFIKGILRGVRCTKSLRALFLHRRPPSWTTLVLYSRAVFIFEGTQDWEFFWLRFWNLRYFFVSYVKILRFYKKKFDWPIIGGGTIFPPSPRTTQNEKNFELGQNFKFFFSSIKDPKYDPIIFFFNSIN
jgi:hypothetical protein